MSNRKSRRTVDSFTTVPAPKIKKPRLHRRLRVVLDREDCEGYVPTIRDVYLESCNNPFVEDGETGTLVEGDWATDLFNLSLPCQKVIDLIRWADQQELHVVYEPAGNMAGWFNRKASDDVQFLFDVG